MASKGDEITFSKDQDGKKIILGHGSCCVVFKGIKKGGLDVALKRLQTCSGVAKLIKRETSIFNSIEPLRRENIVGYYGRHEDPDESLQYIIMELCDATLKDMIEKTDRWKSVCLKHDIQECHINRHNLLKQCLNGICGIHKQTIAHRDLKPSNILLKIERQKVDKNNLQIVAKLADFGLSHEADRETDYTHSTVMTYAATEGWMSPELDKKQREEVNERTDIFSMGLLIFYTLKYTGGEGSKYLFGGTQAEAQSNIRNADESYRNDRLQALDVTGRHLIERMTRQDPATRPCVIECMMHPLFMSATQQIKMMKDFANATEEKNTDLQIKHVRQDLEAIKPAWDAGNWKTKMGLQMKIDKYVKKMNSQNYIEVVRALRHKHTHKGDVDMTGDLIKELWDMDPTDTSAKRDPAKYLSYFTMRFPAMVTDVYGVMTKHQEHLIQHHGEMEESIHHKPCPIKYCPLNTQHNHSQDMNVDE